MNDEEWLKEYELTLRVQTDVDLDTIKDLKFWENQSHSDCSPFFLVTNIIKADEIQD